MKRYISTVLIVFLTIGMKAQVIELNDDFENPAESLPWTADNINLDPSLENPFPGEGNSSSTVLFYEDTGAEFGNLFFDVPINFDLTENSTFSFKIYVPSESITGDQPNQVSLKLQNGDLSQPWTTQTEIIKPIVPDEWQTVSFDFSSDEFINQNGSSPDPTVRFDLNRVLIQVNGEFNFDLVDAYIDDFAYDGVLDPDANPTNSIYTELVWADEFENDGPVNDTKWFHQTILPNGNSWFNNEQQHYTDRIDNSFVEDGFLHIVAKEEVFTDQGVTKNYTSARLNSKFAFTYGRVVARARLPFGFGTWPAIWTLGKNIIETGGYWSEEYGEVFWPACGEIDIMEHWGSNQNVISAALHTPSSFGATENYGTIVDTDVSEEFHIYEMEWSPDAIKFSVDGSVYYTYEPEIQNAETWPFDSDQYILLNVAIESIVSSAFEESDMVIDYVRVYQEEGALSATDQVRDENVKIYPNPAGDVLWLEHPSASASGRIEIFSLTGEKVLTAPLAGGKNQVDVSELPAGAYVINLLDTSFFGTKTFIKL